MLSIARDAPEGSDATIRLLVRFSLRQLRSASSAQAQGGAAGKGAATAIGLSCWLLKVLSHEKLPSVNAHL